MKRARFVLFVLLLTVSFLIACGDDDDDANDDDANDDDASDDDASDDDDDDDNNDDDNDTGPPPDLLEGVYVVSGTDANYGAYSGQLEFRKSGKEGDYDFVRLVRYDELTFGDYDHIETVWTGTASLTDYNVAVAITLRRAEFIRSYNGLVRSDEDRTPLEVTGVFSLAEDVLTGAYESEGQVVAATETAAWINNIGPDPIWVDEDATYESHAEPPELFKGAFTLLLRVLGGADYHAMEFFDDYRDSELFLRWVHYMPRFRTDLDFYRAHPTALRVPNKVLDNIAAFEAQRRADAFKYTLTEKAAVLDAQMPIQNINEHGMIVQYVLDSDPPEYIWNYDSLLWTGTYVASQAYRYRATAEPEALDNMLAGLEGIITCVEITQDPTQFARTLRTIGQQGDQSDKGQWHAGTGPWEGIEWHSPGNNDMLHGVFYGYAAALLALPDDPAYDTYRQRMTDTVVSLTENCDVVADSLFNPIPMNMLAYLLTGDSQYLTGYQQAFNAALRFWILAGNGMFYLYGVSDWSGQHLNTTAMITLALLDELQNQPVQGLVQTGFEAGMLMTQKARQPLFALAGHAFADPGSAFADIRDDAVWALREMPLPKRQLDIDLRVAGTWCASPIPSLPWKLDWMDGHRHQGMFGTPLFMRGGSSCVYKDNPLSYASGEADFRQNSADFLHAYWLGRLYGVLTGDE